MREMWGHIPYKKMEDCIVLKAVFCNFSECFFGEIPWQLSLPMIFLLQVWKMIDILLSKNDVVSKVKFIIGLRMEFVET